MMHILQLVGQILMIVFLLTVFAEEVDYSHTGTAAGNYEKYKRNGDKFEVDTPEASLLFLFSNFLYIATVLASCIDKPWRKPFYTNFPFMVVLLILAPYSILITVVPETRV